MTSMTTATPVLSDAKVQPPPAKKQKLHPTGERRGCVGKGDGDLVVKVQDASENECPAYYVIRIRRDGRIYSMGGEPLGLKCDKSLRKCFDRCIKKNNTVLRFRQEDSGFQNQVHAGVLERMLQQAEERDEELDEESFGTSIHDLADELADKFEHIDSVCKTCCQDLDLEIFIYRID